MAIADSANQEVRETVVPLLLCPSDPAPKLFTLGGILASAGGSGSSTSGTSGNGGNGGKGGGKGKTGTGIEFDPNDDDEDAWEDEPDDSPADGGDPLFRIARGNYVGVFGSVEIEKGPGKGDGTFFFGRGIRFAQVTDGLSNTIMVGERAARRGGSLWQGVVSIANKPMARIVGVADHPPNRNHHFDDFSSYHTSGVHFLHGDGSVRYCNNTIRFSIYKASSTIDGGEIPRSN